jgi:hypothetical protein
MDLSISLFLSLMPLTLSQGFGDKNKISKKDDKTDVIHIHKPKQHTGGKKKMFYKIL